MSHTRLFRTAFLLLVITGCASKTAKEKVNITSVKVNNNASTFYAICADEHFGWCSEKFSTYDEASTALKSHKDSTGHTDNTVSNDCPF